MVQIIQSKAATKEYKDNYDRIFGKKEDVKESYPSHLVIFDDGYCHVMRVPPSAHTQATAIAIFDISEGKWTKDKHGWFEKNDKL